MKKYIFIAAAFAALLSCSKSEQPNNETSGTGFEKGQQVTLTVKAGEPSTRVSSALNDDGTTVDFKWEATDEIKVTVNGNDATFRVSKLSDDGKSAEFTGPMPDSGDEFDIQYPSEGVAESDLESQDYSTSGEPIPHDKMLFTAEGCTLSDMPFTLEAQYAALRLNLWGTDQTISKIMVTNTSSSATPKPTYTLTISGGVTLPTAEANAQAFFIVVPAGDDPWNFSAEVFDNLEKSICSFAPSAPQNFQKGKILNMNVAKEVKKASTVLLPGKFSVSATKKVNFTKGNLYYSTTDSKYHIEAQQNVTSATLGQSQYDATHVCHFYWSNTTDWETSGREPWTQTYAYSAQSTGDKFFCGIDNPMTVDGQSGLYALTGGSTGEWYYLLNTRSVNGGTGEGYSYLRATINNDVNGGVYGLIIYPDNYTSQTSATTYTSSEWTAMEKAGCVFLPAAGNRYGSSLRNVGSYGYYWSSSPLGSLAFLAYFLYFFSGNVYPAYNLYRSYGFSVRLVSAAQ